MHLLNQGIKYYCILALLLVFVSALNAQKVLWASELIDFSSERKTNHHISMIDDNGYKANQVLGEPNIYPGTDGSTRAWTPRRNSNIDYVIVGFKEMINIQQVAIVESINPSALYQVYAYDQDSTEYLLNTFKPGPIPIKGRLINLFVEETPYKVKYLKVVLDGSTVPGFNGIDAIAISDSKEPITISIDIADGIYNSIKPEKLGSNINTPFKDLKPLVSPDDKTLYFSRVGHPENNGGRKDLEDIWYSERDENGEWKDAKNLGEPFNNDGPNFVSSVIPFNTGFILLLGNRYLKDRMIQGLSITYKGDSSYSKPQPVLIDDYENFSPYASFQLSHNRDAIIMSVQRRNTLGGRDLYVTFLQDDGTWTTPKNLGEVINTSDEESSPFLAVDGRTLYFSSKGHLGFGGSDVYMSRRLDDTWTNWSEPENLGPIINTENDEMFFHIAYNNRYAYYTIGTGDDADIYRFALPVFQLPLPIIHAEGLVVNKNTQEPIEKAEVIFYNLTDNTIEAKVISDSTGYVEASVPSGIRYEIRAQAEGYVYLDNNYLDLKDIFENDTVNFKIEMTPTEVGERIALDNIYFDFDKATLRKESIPQLARIVKFLEENNKIKIQLDGHTCSMGREDYNQKLSEARAQSVRDFILNSGIKKNRVKSVGFGENQPLVSNDTEENRKKNRRVEFVITDN